MIDYHQKTTGEYKTQYSQTQNFALKANYFVDLKTGENKKDSEWMGRLKNFDSSILVEIKKNLTSLLADISLHKQVQAFSAVTDSRLLVGLGNAHIKETYLNLHHIYGVPYIPGSSVKGICRHYVISEVLDRFGDNLNCLENLLLLNVESFLDSPDIEADLKKKTQHEDEVDKEKKKYSLKQETLTQAVEYISILVHRLKAEKKEGKSSAEESEITEKNINWTELDLARRIFGNNDRAGGIVFFDAFPQDCKIELDIMNPHYGKYYGDQGGRKMPVDFDTPVPVKFAAVGSGAAFRFALSNRSFGRDDDLLTQAKEWLQKALENHGIGAKTAVGYGFFKDFRDLSTELTAQKEERLPEKDRLLLRVNQKDLAAIGQVMDNLKAGEYPPDQGQDTVHALEKLFTRNDSYIDGDQHALSRFCNFGFAFLSLHKDKLLKTGSPEIIIQNLKKYGSHNLRAKIEKKEKTDSISGNIEGTPQQKEILILLSTSSTISSLQKAYEYLCNLSPGESLEIPKIIAREMQEVLEQPGKRLRRDLKKSGDKSKYLQKSNEIMRKK